MTKKVFWQDPYLTQLDTHITSVQGNMITVAETIFFAFSGGQESDQGMIGGCEVLDAHKDAKAIIYTLVNGHALKPGDPVSIHIDWTRRYRLMRLHFAAELVLELCYQTFPAIEKLGAHIAQDKARIDFAWDTNLSGILPSIREKAQGVIDADYAIVSAFSDEENERRYWEIDGFSRVPCGGTHLRRTGEIGKLDLKRKNVGKGKERIEIFVG
jgi:Ser-tRNA(Ala) deacylase AlaX